jgi:hypothetical protein
MKIQTIFVEYCGKGLRAGDRCRPKISATSHIELPTPKPDDEVWAFAPGDTVKCKMQRFANSNGDELLAQQKLDGKRNSP